MAGRSNEKTRIFKSNLKKVRVGDKIGFIRNDIKVIGEVIQVGENTAMVTIDDATRRLLDISTNVTVVNHKNYTFIPMAALLDSLVV